MSLSAPTDPPQSSAAVSSPTWGELERLLARWRAGDPAALDLLLARIHPMLYRWALANATDVDDADDIAQQALVAVHRKIGQFRSESPLPVWLYRLTTRTAAQRRRTFARRKALNVRAHAEVARRVYETDPAAAWIAIVSRRSCANATTGFRRNNVPRCLSLIWRATRRPRRQS